MNFPHFLRIEHEQRDGSPSFAEASEGRRHIVLHLAEPRMALEITPDLTAPDKIGRGLIKRVCVPNSWAGDYGESAKLIATAQEFFEQSFAEPVPAAEARRFAR